MYLMFGLFGGALAIMTGLAPLGIVGIVKG